MTSLYRLLINHSIHFATFVNVLIERFMIISSNFGVILIEQEHNILAHSYHQTH